MSQDAETSKGEKLMFNIDVSNMYWITKEDDPEDLSAHGDMAATIGDERFEYTGTVSAAAIYLLKTLTENHLFGEDNLMMPCCGHEMIATENFTVVHILGCPNGIDWEVTHTDDKIKIKTETGNEVFVDYEDYREQVFNFADKVEAFYASSRKKFLPEDEFDRDGYIALWNEWNIRRYGKACQKENLFMAKDKGFEKEIHKKSRGKLL